MVGSSSKVPTTRRVDLTPGKTKVEAKVRRQVVVENLSKILTHQQELPPELQKMPRVLPENLDPNRKADPSAQNQNRKVPVKLAAAVVTVEEDLYGTN